MGNLSCRVILSSTHFYCAYRQATKILSDSLVFFLFFGRAGGGRVSIFAATFRWPQKVTVRYSGREKTKLFPPRKSLISDIPAGDGKTANSFLQCGSLIESDSLREPCGMQICYIYLRTTLRRLRECLCSIFLVFGMKQELKKNNPNQFIYLRSVKRMLFSVLVVITTSPHPPSPPPPLPPPDAAYPLSL